MSSHAQYEKMELLESMLPADPFELFASWLEFASREEPMGGICFSLATASASGKPSCRTVLFNEIIEGGFSFYTNYESHKGRDMAENNQVSAQFFWPQSERQVRIDGVVKKIAASTSDAYFAGRPRDSQIGAWASSQSSVIANREELEQQMHDFTQQFEGKDVPRPPHWGGYVIVPNEIEFWQGRLSRLHDRIRYKLADRVWTYDRLSP